MNVGVPGSAPSFHKMSVEEYKRMSFVPTKANLEKRRLEQEQAALKDQQTDAMSNLEDPRLTKTSSAWEERREFQTEVRRLSGAFNAPTSAEMDLIKKNEKSSGGLKNKFKRWTKRGSPPTIA